MISVLPNNIRGIIFDLDGTLYHMKWFMKPIMTLQLIPNIFWLPKYMSVRKQFAGKDLRDEATLMKELSKALAQKTGKENTDSILSWIINRFYQVFQNVMPFVNKSRPGLKETFSSLRSNGYKLGVLSDFSHIPERLTGLNIPQSLFHTISSSESEGALKPCARPFLQISKKWNIAPEHILVIGDRDDTDGVAAQNAGMQFTKISDKKNMPKNAFSWETIKNNLNNLPPIS